MTFFDTLGSTDRLQSTSVLNIDWWVNHVSSTALAAFRQDRNVMYAVSLTCGPLTSHALPYSAQQIVNTTRRRDDMSKWQRITTNHASVNVTNANKTMAWANSCSENRTLISSPVSSDIWQISSQLSIIHSDRCCGLTYITSAFPWACEKLLRSVHS